jgi:hypothetical protein
MSPILSTQVIYSERIIENHQKHEEHRRTPVALWAQAGPKCEWFSLFHHGALSLLAPRPRSSLFTAWQLFLRPPGTRSLRRDGRVNQGVEGRPRSRNATGCLAATGVQATRRNLSRPLANGRVAVTSVPRATAAIAPERAGPERPDRRVETLAPTEGLVRGRGAARVRTLVCASSVARAGGSEGWARRPARATAPGPRGKKEEALTQ